MWIGRCEERTSHRGAILPVNDEFDASERFAIEFVQLTESGLLFEGPVDQLSSDPFYGVPVRSATDGVVVAIGGGRFAFYAHLIPGLRVVVGDRVRAGVNVLGRLGNSGNSDAPHLHFHVMDGRGPLSSNGLPFVFDAEIGVEGTVTNLIGISAGDPVELDTSSAGDFQGRLPLDLQLVDFGGNRRSGTRCVEDFVETATVWRARITTARGRARPAEPRLDTPFLSS